MSSGDMDFVKEQVAAHWGRRAPGFDDGFGHSIRTLGERAAWDRIFDLALTGRDPLDALAESCGRAGGSSSSTVNSTLGF